MNYFPEYIKNPQVVQRTFDGVEKDCYLVEISGKDYKICEDTSHKFWCNSKPGAYGAGFLNTKDDPSKTTRIGLLGQMAYAKLFNDSVDISYKEFGDKYDNLIGRFKVDVKCPSYNYGNAKVQRINSKGITIEVDKDFYVVSFVESENKNDKKAVIVMVGFVLKDYVEKAKLVSGVGNKHFNCEIWYKDVKSIVGFREAKLEYDKSKKIPSMSVNCCEHSVTVEEKEDATV